MDGCMDGWMDGWDLEILRDLPDYKAAAAGLDTGQNKWVPILWA